MHYTQHGPQKFWLITLRALTAESAPAANPSHPHGSSMTSFVELTESELGTPVPMHEVIGKLNSEFKKMVGQSTHRSITPELRDD